MSTQTHPTSRPHGTPETAEPATKRRTAGRAIGASVVAGAVAALVLALVVLPGGTEATITGALLLGFGFGWALMATLTVRRTRQPQRWAVVPAVAMGATGAALVVFTPGNQTLTALNWVWPPLMVALAGWMFVQMRRSVTGKSRWVLTPVIAVLVLASIGATYDNIVRTDQAKVAAPGKLYDVAGHRLHLDCHGQGSPTVVLSNGLGGISAAWARIAGPIAETTRVCAYDRAGQGWSEEAANPRDGVESAEDLHTLLAAAGEHGPFVMVGHSTGGTYALTYAARYPEQVTAITSEPKYYRNQRDEVLVIPAVFHQAQALTSLGDRPLAVLTASVTATGTDGWVGAQDQLTALSTNSVHRTVRSSHTGLLEDARPAAVSVRAITEVVTSVRTGTPLPAR